jgi:2-succinyl-6-hydroxy-2,4-cyclohexadiene-1-carboxylate synthase
MIEPRSAFVDADNVRLHYLEWDHTSVSKHVLPVLSEFTVEDTMMETEDSDDIPLVLLHGLSSTSDTWRLVAQQLCDRHVVVAFDLRGHGLSEQPADGYDLVTIAEDVISGMARLGLGQVALGGHGWGGRVALALAARHPALVSHLILVDCTLVEPRHWPGMTRERFIHESEIAPRTFTSRVTYLRTLQREMASFWSPEVESIFLTQVCEMPDGTLLERLRPEYQRKVRESFWEDRALSHYGKLTCPVLLVPAAAKPQPHDELPERLEHADEYAAAKGQIVAQISRTIQRCSVLWMPNTTHYIQLQHPQFLSRAIVEFLQV